MGAVDSLDGLAHLQLLLVDLLGEFLVLTFEGLDQFSINKGEFLDSTLPG